MRPGRAARPADDPPACRRPALACREKAAAGSGPAAAFRALGGVVGVVLRVAEFDCVLQLVEPEGNGVAERFIRTLKENLLWVRSFETIEELRLALLEFKRTYNEQWMLEKYDYRSPARVRRDLGGLDAAA